MLRMQRNQIGIAILYNNVSLSCEEVKTSLFHNKSSKINSGYKIKQLNSRCFLQGEDHRLWLKREY